MIQKRTQTRTQKKTQTKIQTKTQKKRQTKTQTRTQMRKRTKTKGRRLKEEERRSRCRRKERTRFPLFSLRSSWDSTSSWPLLLITPASRNQCSVTRSKTFLNINFFPKLPTNCPNTSGVSMQQQRHHFLHSHSESETRFDHQ